jgi:hypothetical protein
MKLRPLSVAAVCLAVIVLMAKSRFESPGRSSATATSRAAADSRTPVEYRRAPDNTYLTFPEWYLVYSPREYSHHLVDRPPSQFPFIGHLGQFWQAYRAVYQATKDAQPFNLDYHVMIWVIGLSTTAEYGTKWLYEAVFGQVTEPSRGSGLTAEDRLAASIAQEYVDFIDVEPWYRFDFVGPLKRLWTETGWWGDHPVRKWERKYFLTSEYLGKAAYGWLIKRMSESSYGVESEYTVVTLDRVPPNLPDEVKVLETFSDEAVLMQMPRYQVFTNAAVGLAKANVNFLEIAGNTGPILVSALVATEYEPSGLDVMFVQPIMTEPGHKRIAFTLPVSQLCEALRKFDDPNMRVEHIYDY